MSRDILRAPAELRFAAELAALEANDTDPRPPGWRLSPRAVRTFICGSDVPLSSDGKGKKAAGKKTGRTSVEIGRKFFGDDVAVERAIVGLAGNRGVLLVGEPGTAKSLLSELLAAAISGRSTTVVQGTAATTEEHLRYSWNYAMLLAEGPSPQALIPSPVMIGMNAGSLVRFEEITRCPPEVQDALVSILSEKMLSVPELQGEDATVFGRPGFNIIATANIRDRGVHEMSAALKRRFNFETISPIRERDQEIELVRREGARLLQEAGAAVEVPVDVVELLVNVFQDLRAGTTAEGTKVEKPTTVISTAEAVSVLMSAGIEARYYGDGAVTPEGVVRHLGGTVFKDSRDDLAKLRQYFKVVVKRRADAGDGRWPDLYQARKWLPR